MDTKRSFSVVRVNKTNGSEIHVPTGRYISSSPRSAAEKAFTQITREKNIEMGTLLITMRETTKDSKGNMWTYNLTKQLRSEPLELNGRTIRYETLGHAIAPIGQGGGARSPLRRSNAMTRSRAKRVMQTLKLHDERPSSGLRWKKAATRMRVRSALLKPIYHNIQETVPLDIQELYDNMQLNPHSELEPFMGDEINTNALLMYLLRKHKNDCIIMPTTGGRKVLNEVTIYNNKIIMLPTGLPTGMDLTSTIQSFEQRKTDYHDSITRNERLMGVAGFIRPEIKRIYNHIAGLDNVIKELTSTNMEGHNEFIKMIRDCTKSMIIIPIHLKFDGGGHANIIIVNKTLKTIEWYEPHGFEYGGEDEDEAKQPYILEEFKKLFKPLKGYKIYSPSDLMTSCPLQSGLQRYNKYLNKVQTRDTVYGRISSPAGYCVAFSMILADIRLTYPLVPPLDLMKNTIELLTSSPEILRDFVYGYSLKLQEVMKVLGDHAVEYIHLSALENPTNAQLWRLDALSKKISQWQFEQLQAHSTCDTCYEVLDKAPHRGATLGARHLARSEALVPARRLLAEQAVLSGARARQRDTYMREAREAERASQNVASTAEKAALHKEALRLTQASIDLE
jgi:hypothetical protein